MYGILGMIALFSTPEDGMMKLLLEAKADANYQIVGWHEIPGKEGMEGHAWSACISLLPHPYIHNVKPL